MINYFDKGNIVIDTSVVHVSFNSRYNNTRLRTKELIFIEGIYLFLGHPAYLNSPAECMCSAEAGGGGG
jgi:hypothetical protein